MAITQATRFQPLGICYRTPPFLPRRLTPPLRGEVPKRKETQQVGGGPTTHQLNQQAEQAAAAAAAAEAAASRASASAAVRTANARRQTEADEKNIAALKDYAASSDADTAALIDQAIDAGDIKRGFELAEADQAADYRDYTGQDPTGDAEQDQTIWDAETESRGTSNAAATEEYGKTYRDYTGQDPTSYAEQDQTIWDAETESRGTSNAAATEEYGKTFRDYTGQDPTGDAEQDQTIWDAETESRGTSNTAATEEYGKTFRDYTGQDPTGDAEQDQTIWDAETESRGTSNAAATEEYGKTFRDYTGQDPTGDAEQDQTLWDAETESRGTSNAAATEEYGKTFRDYTGQDPTGDAEQDQTIWDAETESRSTSNTAATEEYGKTFRDYTGQDPTGDAEQDQTIWDAETESRGTSNRRIEDRAGLIGVAVQQQGGITDEQRDSLPDATPAQITAAGLGNQSPVVAETAPETGGASLGGYSGPADATGADLAEAQETSLPEETPAQITAAGAGHFVADPESLRDLTDKMIFETGQFDRPANQSPVAAGGHFVADPESLRDLTDKMIFETESRGTSNAAATEDRVGLIGVAVQQQGGITDEQRESLPDATPAQITAAGLGNQSPVVAETAPETGGASLGGYSGPADATGADLAEAQETSLPEETPAQITAAGAGHFVADPESLRDLTDKMIFETGQFDRPANQSPVAAGGHFVADPESLRDLTDDLIFETGEPYRPAEPYPVSPWSDDSDSARILRGYDGDPVPVTSPGEVPTAAPGPIYNPVTHPNDSALMALPLPGSGLVFRTLRGTLRGSGPVVRTAFEDLFARSDAFSGLGPSVKNLKTEVQLVDQFGTVIPKVEPAIDRTTSYLATLNQPPAASVGPAGLRDNPLLAPHHDVQPARIREGIGTRDPNAARNRQPWEEAVDTDDLIPPTGGTPPPPSIYSRGGGGGEPGVADIPRTWSAANTVLPSDITGGSTAALVRTPSGLYVPASTVTAPFTYTAPETGTTERVETAPFAYTAPETGTTERVETAPFTYTAPETGTTERVETAPFTYTAPETGTTERVETAPFTYTAPGPGPETTPGPGPIPGPEPQETQQYQGHQLQGTQQYQGHQPQGTQQYQGHQPQGTQQYQGHQPQGTQQYQGHQPQETQQYQGHQPQETQQYQGAPQHQVAPQEVPQDTLKETPQTAPPLSPGPTQSAPEQPTREPPRRGRRPRLPLPGQQAPGEQSVQVQGPPDGYARRIRHTERVEYSYDPETQRASARVVESSEPVIVARDASPPDVQERQVGAFDVVPEGRDVRATPREDAELAVPPGVLARLRAQAERDGGGGPVTRTETVSYEHDIDTQETDQRIEGGSRRERALAAAGALAGGARAAAGTVSERAQTLARRTAESFPETTAAIGERLHPASSQARSKESLDALVARLIRQAGQKPPPAKGGTKRRASSSKAKERRPSYQQPTIIVVREPGPTGRRRYGGL